MTVAEEKKLLRRECLQKRLSLSTEQKKAADGAICQAIAALDAFREADVLLLFSPMRGEPDLTPLASLAAARGIKVAFPRCERGEMTFHVVQSENDFSPDQFGIPSPHATLPLAQATARTLCVLPGLAAGRDGSRLGYGGGFYDKFLATFEGITLFPIYDFLLFDTLPTEATDRPVDILITEKGE